MRKNMERTLNIEIRISTLYI